MRILRTYILRELLQPTLMALVLFTFVLLVGNLVKLTDLLINKGVSPLAIGQMFATAFPDGRGDVQSIHAAGNVAIVEFIGRGTHKGDLMGIAPTGRQVSIPVCAVYELRDGKIYAEREYMDMLTMMQQLGVAPAPATA